MGVKSSVIAMAITRKPHCLSYRERRGRGERDRGGVGMSGVGVCRMLYITLSFYSVNRSISPSPPYTSLSLSLSLSLINSFIRSFTPTFSQPSHLLTPSLLYFHSMQSFIQLSIRVLSTHKRIHPCSHLSIESSTHAVIHPCSHAPMQSFIHGVMHPCNHPFMESFTHAVTHP